MRGKEDEISGRMPKLAVSPRRRVQEASARLGAAPAVAGSSRRRADWLLEGSGWPLLVLLSDVVALTLGLWTARLAAGAALDASADRLMWVYPLTVLAVFGARGMYRHALQTRPLDEAVRALAGTSLAAMVLVTLAAFTELHAEDARFIARAWLFATVYVAGFRVLLLLARHYLRTSGRIGKPTLIVGAGRIGAAVERSLVKSQEIGLRPIGYLDLDPVPDPQVEGRQAPVLGSPSEVAAVADQTGAKHVILAFTSAPDSVLIPIVRECERRRLEVSLVPRLFESMSERISLQHLGGVPVLALRPVNPRSWQFAVKHVFDRVGAAILLLALSPMMLLAAVAIKLSSPGPVFFQQRRIGRDGREFDMLKFRSMRVQSYPEPVQLLPPGLAPGGVEGEDRRTSVGRMLRRFGLDELPQFINVLKGDMSLIGPRPERPEFVEIFEERILRYEDRHRVKSGITGWAQVHGLRGRTSLPDRLELDNYYIQNWSLALDLKILLMTMVAIFRPVE